MSDRRDQAAAGLATALLAGPWIRADMHARCRSALGRPAAPAWLGRLIDHVLSAYRDPPADRPRELAAYLQTGPAWATAWASRRPPRIVEWTPVPTTVTSRPWPVALLPDLGALAGLFDIDQGELAWFADLHGLERTAAEPLRHYRWTVLPKRDGVRVLAAPKPRLKEIQRRLLHHVLRPIPVHDAAHGGVRGRSVRSAVTPHVGAETVIRADLSSYFASISGGRVWGLLQTAGLPEAVAYTVTGLVTTTVPRHVLRRLPAGERAAFATARPQLPQGAPTSPAPGQPRRVRPRPPAGRAGGPLRRAVHALRRRPPLQRRALAAPFTQPVRREGRRDRARRGLPAQRPQDGRAGRGRSPGDAGRGRQ